jgi:uncharacterized membrane protein
MNPAALYLWLKALHVAAAITFVAGVIAASVLLTSLAGSNSERPRAVLSLRAWQQNVTTPAMLMVWGLGLVLALRGGWLSSLWLQAKLALVAALSVIHGMQSGALRRLAGGSVLRSCGLRFFGPLTIGLTVGIALLVIVKPF